MNYLPHNPTHVPAVEYLDVGWKPNFTRYDYQSNQPNQSNQASTRLAHRLSLPHLSIPTTRPQTDDSSPSATPEISPFLTPRTSETTPDTPLSSSPISGVVDLTMAVKTLANSPVTTGGFSDIYRGAWFRKNGETVMVAVKLLRVFSAQDHVVAARKRLNWEVYIWHRLEHPNIAQLFGTSYHMSGRPSMIMKWYDNGNATDFLRGPGGTSADRLSLALDVARGLEYLHTQTSPIIHGDLKSNNVLITKDVHAVLSDFGLSQVIHAIQSQPTGLTPSNPESGPTRWQAPELHQDDTQPDIATDVWGFGCTAYEMLSGNIPYHYRQRDASVIKAVENHIKPSGPDGLVLLVPDIRLERILDQCWSFLPSERPSMTSVVIWLEDISTH